MNAQTFQDAIRAAGFQPPDDLQPGKFHRFSANGKRGDKAGYCKLFADGTAGIIGDWRSGEQVEWFADRSEPLNQAEQMERRRQAQEAARQARELLEGEQVKAAGKAAEIWQAAKPAPSDHPYLAKKKTSAHLLRLEADGRLICPVYNADGKIQTLQFISHNGEKSFLPGGKVAGGFCAIGKPANGEPLLLAEGWATGASLHEASGRPCLVAFNAGNLPKAAEIIKRIWPKSRLIVCGDDDRQTEGNPGKTAALKAAELAGGIAIFPVFSQEATGTDFNDMLIESGLQAVKNHIEAACQFAKTGNAPRFQLVPVCDLLRSPKPHNWLIRGYLESDNLALVFGDPEAGKSLLVQGLVCAIVTGREWCGFKPKQGMVV